MKQHADGSKEYLAQLETTSLVTGGVLEGTRSLEIGEGDTFEVQLGKVGLGFCFKTICQVKGGKLVDVSPYANQDPLNAMLKTFEGQEVHCQIDRVTQ